MATGELNVPVTEAEVTSEWLSAAMDAPGLEIDELERLGGNNPVVSQLFRAHVSMGCNMATAVVKIPSAREEDRRLIVSESGFARETVSYRMLERWQGGFVPRVLAEVRDEETEIAALVLEDLGKPFGSQEPGQVSIDAASIVLERLAELHGAFWNDRSLRQIDWMRPAETSDLFSEPVDAFGPAWRAMVDSGAVEIGPNAMRLGERLVTGLGDVMERLLKRPQTLIHADLHQANLMFREGDESDPVVIDWGNTASCGSTSDVAKFLATSLQSDVLARHEESLLRTYHEALVGSPSLVGEEPAPDLIRGQGEGEAGNSYSFDRLMADYRLAQLATLANYVIANFGSKASEDEPETSSPSLRAVLAAVDAVGTIP